jgi:hypothetical protein
LEAVVCVYFPPPVYTRDSSSSAATVAIVVILKKKKKLEILFTFFQRNGRIFPFIFGGSELISLERGSCHPPP